MVHGFLTKGRCSWCLALVVVLSSSGCSPRLERMSPREIVKLSNKAAKSRDRELLKRLAYVPEGQTREQVQATVDSLIEKSTESSTAGAMFKSLFRFKAGAERIYGDRAYVYLYAGSVVTACRPYAVLALAKQDGMWKIRGERRECETPEFWRRILQTSPEDTDALYYLGLRYSSEERVMFNSTQKWPDGDKVGNTFVVVPHDTVKATQYFDEYLRKAPNGFWAPVIQDGSGAPIRKDGLRKAQEALRTNPDDLEALGVLACNYENLGFYRKSKLAAQRFVALAPDDNKFRRGEAMRDRIRTSDFNLAVQKEYFDKNPEKLKEVEAELGFKLFDGEVTLP